MAATFAGDYCRGWTHLALMWRIDRQTDKRTTIFLYHISTAGILTVGVWSPVTCDLAQLNQVVTLPFATTTEQVRLRSGNFLFAPVCPSVSRYARLNSL